MPVSRIKYRQELWPRSFFFKWKFVHPKASPFNQRHGKYTTIYSTVFNCQTFSATEQTHLNSFKFPSSSLHVKCTLALILAFKCLKFQPVVRIFWLFFCNVTISHFSLADEYQHDVGTHIVRVLRLLWVEGLPRELRRISRYPTLLSRWSVTWYPVSHDIVLQTIPVITNAAITNYQHINVQILS